MDGTRRNNRSVNVAKKSESKNFQEILSDLKKDIIADLYVLEGDEDYLKAKLVKALETLLVTPATRALDMAVFDPGGRTGPEDLKRIRNELQTPPFLSKRRLIVVRKSGLFYNARKSTARLSEASGEEDSDEKDEEVAQTVNASPAKAGNGELSISNLLEYVSGNSCLVFVEEKVDKRQKALLEKVYQKGVLGLISRPDPATLRTWVRKEFEREKISISAQTTDSLIDRNDGSLFPMSNEIQKLILLAKSVPKSTIDDADLDDIGIADLKGSIFDLVDALSAQKAGEAYRLLEALFAQKQPVPLIFFMLARHIRQLIIAKDLGTVSLITQRMKVMPFVANKLYHQSRNVSFETLEAIYRSCHDADVSVKTSRITDRIALDVLIAESSEQMKQSKR
jgi:DNA polymerase III subunit delta